MPLQIVTRVIVYAGPPEDPRYRWSVDAASALKPRNMWHPTEGRFFFRFPGGLNIMNYSVCVTTDGILPGATRTHSDVVPVVRSTILGPVDLEIELIRSDPGAGTATEYNNADSNFWFI